MLQVQRRMPDFRLWQPEVPHVPANERPVSPLNRLLKSSVILIMTDTSSSFICDQQTKPVCPEVHFTGQIMDIITVSAAFSSVLLSDISHDDILAF